MREKEQGYIMLYEMLLGKGSIQGGGKLKVSHREVAVVPLCRLKL